MQFFDGNWVQQFPKVSQGQQFLEVDELTQEENEFYNV